jgi:hypothetical protein
MYVPELLLSVGQISKKRFVSNNRISKGVMSKKTFNTQF